jgi:3-hydroxyisobutyrate dehydrogenase-like beta-hydroxyacid dehydrogenase
MSAVGFIGLGAMGSRIAGRLLDAGNEMYGSNRTKAKAEPLIARGLRWCDSPRGQGLLIKLAVNISLAVQTLAFSEGLLLAERGGIDPRVAADAMSSSSIGSPMLKARVPLLLDLPEQAWFDVALMHKDIRLARAAAGELAVPLPTATVADEMLSRASELGYEHRDLAALHEVLAMTSAE